MTIGLDAFHVSIPLDVTQAGSAKDIKGSTITVPRGADCSLDIGLFSGSEIFTDVSLLAEVLFEIKDSLGGTLRVSKTITSFDSSVDEDTWADQSKAHIKIELSQTDTNQDLSNEKAKTFYGVISCKTTDDKKFPLGWFNLCIQEDGTTGVGGGSTPTPVAPLKFQFDADGWPELWNPDTSMWHPIFISGTAGQEQFTMGEGHA